MLISSQRQIRTCKASLSDIAPVFNLIQQCSEDGYFNEFYLTLHQTDVALKLFSVWLFGRIRLDSGEWRKASLRVIRHEGAFAGFVFMLYLQPSGVHQQIYLCAIETKYRGRGLGRQLIQAALQDMKDGSIVEVECLPKAIQMKNLLLHMGFKSINHTESTILKKTAEKFRLSYVSKQEDADPEQELLS